MPTTSQVKEVAPDTLRPHPSNARTHPKKQRCRLAKAIQKFGFTVPIVIDENNVILAGHGRWLVAGDLGLTTVPVVVLSGLSEAERPPIFSPTISSPRTRAGTSPRLQWRFYLSPRS